MKIASLAALATLLAAAPAMASDLVLNLRTEASGGRIAVAVYRDAESLRRGQGAVKTAMVERTGDTTSTTIRGLAPGRYAVAVFHDTDGNGRLSTWPVGLPKEAYGFSNDARGRFGPPGFDAAAFDLPTAGTRLTITLR